MEILDNQNKEYEEMLRQLSWQIDDINSLCKILNDCIDYYISDGKRFDNIDVLVQIIQSKTENLSIKYQDFYEKFV